VYETSLSGYAREAAQILAGLHEAEGVSCLREPPEPGDFEGREAIVAVGGGSLLGYAHKWLSGPTVHAAIVVDPSMPAPLALEAYQALAGALAYHGPRGSTSVATLYAGPRHGPRYMLALHAFRGALESPGFTYMVARLPVPPRRVPSGYSVEVYEGVPEGLIGEVVGVYNRAFRVYRDYSGWSVERAREFYSRFGPGELVLAAAFRGGELVGFAEARLYESACGLATAHLALLAVDPGHQGRGLGSALAAAALNRLAEAGAERPRGPWRASTGGSGLNRCSTCRGSAWPSHERGALGALAWSLYCPRCGWEGGGEEYEPFCPRCGGPLEVRGRLPRPRGPVLGEGSTPLVDDGDAVFKLEYLNPTGSFKDRGASLSVWLARRLGYKCVVEDSSGNTGLAVAAYAARLGLRARIHVPAGAARGKVSLLRLLGAEVVAEGDRAAAAERARRDSGECFYVAHSTSPVFLEGVSSIAGELAGAPEPVIVPVSSGTLLLGLRRGLARLGLEKRLVAVQSVAASSLAGRVPVLARVGGGVARLLDALVVGDPPRIEEMAEAVEGVVVAGDGAALEGLRALAGRGFIVEPSSAVRGVGGPRQAQGHAGAHGERPQVRW